MDAKKQKGFTSVGNVLPNRIKEYKLQHAFYKHQAIKYWNEVAGKFVEQAKEQTRAIDFKNGVLLIVCLSKELAYEIRLIAARVINEINQLIGKLVVFAIHIEV